MDAAELVRRLRSVGSPAHGWYAEAAEFVEAQTERLAAAFERELALLDDNARLRAALRDILAAANSSPPDLWKAAGVVALARAALEQKGGE